MDFDISDHCKRNPYALSLVADTYNHSNHRASFPQMSNIVRYSDIMPGLPDMLGKTEDGYSIIEKLMASKKNQERLLQNKEDHLEQQANYFPLEATEKKIFNEVINISEEIKPIQEAIKLEKNRILELQTQIQQLEIPIKSSRTIKQLQIQNDKLNNILHKIKAQRQGGLLFKCKNIQKQYQQLKRQFLNRSSNPLHDQELLRVRQLNQDLKFKIERLHRSASINQGQRISQNSLQFKQFLQQQREKKEFLDELQIHRNQQFKLIEQNIHLQNILTKIIKNQPLGVASSKYITENILPKMHQNRIIQKKYKTNSPTSNILNQLQTHSKGYQRNPKKQNSSISSIENNEDGYISNQKKQKWRKQMNSTRLGQYADIVSAFHNILEH